MSKTADETIERIFAGKPELKREEFESITVEVCGLPKYFINILFDKIDTGKTGKINKQHFLQFWKKEFEKIDIKKRMFKAIAKSGSEYI